VELAPTTQITFGLAFAAGVLSLISPCVLALVPAYMSYISGVSLRSEGGGPDAAGRRRIQVHALLFIGGFTLVFVLFGASATLLGRLLITNQELLGKIAGVLVAGFGLHTLGLLRLPGLDTKRGWTYQGPSGRPHQAFLIGMAFATGWTPCVGPILGGILALASVSATVWQGVGLLLAYAAGMGLPFFLIALTLDRSQRLLAAIKRRHRTVEAASGILLIGIGVLLYTDTFSLLARYMNYLTWL